MTPPILGLIFKSCLTRNLPTRDPSLSLQTRLYSVGQPISMTEKRGVSAVSGSFGETGTKIGGGQGTYTDSSAWNVLYITRG